VNSPGRPFHDVKGTAVVRSAIAREIAAVTGHSLKDVEAILDAHDLGRDMRLTEPAVLKLEARAKLETALVLPHVKTAKALIYMVGVPGLEPGAHRLRGV
jgi:hypothetical protein